MRLVQFCFPGLSLSLSLIQALFSILVVPIREYAIHPSAQQPMPCQVDSLNVG